MLNDLVKVIYKNAVEKGFWESDNLAEKFMLVVTEIAEAVEKLREHPDLKTELQYIYGRKNQLIVAMHSDTREIFNEDDIKYFEKYVKDSIQDEIADTIIRLLDIWGRLEDLSTYPLNIEEHIKLKMLYNSTRKYKHGKQF